MKLDQVNHIPQRDGYGQGLLDLCAAREDVVVLDADVSASTRTNWVHDRYPDHFYNVGISEQDLVGTAAGLALGGQVPFVSTYGVFLSGRAFDQIRTTVCYNDLHVIFGGAHAGISVGPDGATHQALEDLALARVLPRMTVVAPCDSEETRKAVLAAADHPGPVYLRFGREAVPVITDRTTPFAIGKARPVREGQDCAVFACGALVYEALLAAEELAAQGISLQVTDLHTIKPLDAEAVTEAARRCGAVVTAEEHQVAGGLFGAVSELLARTCPVPMEAVAVQDTFGESGPRRPSWPGMAWMLPPSSGRCWPVWPGRGEALATCPFPASSPVSGAVPPIWLPILPGSPGQRRHDPRTPCRLHRHPGRVPIHQIHPLRPGTLPL